MKKLSNIEKLFGIYKKNPFEIGDEVYICSEYKNHKQNNYSMEKIGIVKSINKNLVEVEINEVLVSKFIWSDFEINEKGEEQSTQIELKPNFVEIKPFTIIRHFKFIKSLNFEDN